MPEYNWFDWWHAKRERMNAYKRAAIEPRVHMQLEKGWQPPALTPAQLKWLRRQAADRRYEASEKGRARKARFLQGERGAASNRASQGKYNHSDRGRSRRQDYYWRDPDMCNFRTRKWRTKKKHPEWFENSGTCKPQYSFWHPKRGFSLKPASNSYLETRI